MQLQAHPYSSPTCHCLKALDRSTPHPVTWAGKGHRGEGTRQRRQRIWEGSLPYLTQRCHTLELSGIV